MEAKNKERFQSSRRNFFKYSTMALGAMALGSWGVYGMKLASEADYRHPAYAYWSQKNKGTLSDQEYIVMCGILAPSPHNTQPWRFQIQEQRIEIYADRSRNLGVADHRKKMMMLSVGCALENMAIAAARLGYAVRTEINANNHFDANGFCATLLLEKTGTTTHDPWFDAIFVRQTTRSAYDIAHGVPEHFQNRIDQENFFPGIHLAWYRKPSQLSGITDLHREAVRLWLMKDKRHQDSIKWWRYTRDELERKRDGISIFTSAAPFFIKQAMTWMVTPEMFARKFGKQGEIDLIDGISSQTPLWGMIYAEKPDYNSRILAGRLAEKIYLHAASQQYCICPLAYVTEMDSMAKKMKKLSAITPNHELLFLFRVGKAPLLEKSVRRNIKQFLI